MPQITDIRPQKKALRVNIYLDGEFAFGLPREIQIKEKLVIGQVLSPAEVKRLVKENDLAKAYDGVLRFLAIRPRSRQEIGFWLKKRELGEETKKQILAKLEERGLISDEEFARWWIEQRTTFNLKGKRAIEIELRQKGIARSIIDELMGSHSSTVSELELAQRAAEKKLKSFKNLSPLEFRQKLTNFLLRRGFSWETAEEVVKKLGGLS
jgi:regulatory protein